MIPNTRVAVLFAAFALVACTAGTSSTSSGGSSGSSGTSGTSGSSGAALKPSDYAADCTAENECFGAYFGADACCDGCPTNAIATKDKTRYETDRQTFKATCTTREACPEHRCAFGGARCTNGRCGL